MSRRLDQANYLSVGLVLAVLAALAAGLFATALWLHQLGGGSRSPAVASLTL